MTTATAAPIATATKPTAKNSQPAHSGPSQNEKTAQAVTDKILALLDRGDLPPWDKGWHNTANAQPRNAVTGHRYRGINFWLTLIAQDMGAYEDPRWLTYNQAIQLGGHVNRGEASTQIHLRKPWQPKKKKDSNTIQPAASDSDQHSKKKPKPFWIWMTHNVFNVKQTTGCDLPPLEAQPTLIPHNPLESAEAIIKAMPNPPVIAHYQYRNHAPHYIPARDLVEVPTSERYDRIVDYYNTIFHEITHATGHSSRLNRFKNNVPSQDLHGYGKEELVAGMGSAMLGDLAGTGHLIIERDASYIKHWRDAIAADRTMVLNAAQLAQKAIDYITGQTPPKHKKPETGPETGQPAEHQLQWI